MLVHRRQEAPLCGVTATGHLVVGAKRNEREYASALDSSRKSALVLRADAGLAPRLHLVAIRNEAPKPGYILVVDVLHLIYAEGADFPPRIVSRSAAPALEAALSTTASERRPASSTGSRTSRPCRSWRCGWCRTWSSRRRCGRRTCGSFCSHGLTSFS